MQLTLPLDPAQLAGQLRSLRIDDPGKATIRQIRRLIDALEAGGSPRFIRMEMGIPGLPAPAIATEAEVAALRDGVAASYPPAAGIPPLKDEIARFVRLFLDVEVGADGCVPTVGSLHGSFLLFLISAWLHEGRDTVLFLDPGFSVHRQQARLAGLAIRGIDVAECRGPALRTALERETSDGRVALILYSNPNNPTWMCLTEDELRIIADTATAADILVAEDLAYFGMDFRSDLGTPGRAPYQPTVARYTDQWVLLISSSKAFSFAGQRVGMFVISDALGGREFPALERRFPFSRFSDAFILGALYASCAGVGHSAQYALAALLRAANDGVFSFREHVSPYAVRAGRMKEIFTRHGFTIVYDTDIDRPIADGFYFTIAYPGMTGAKLTAELLRYGISAISLEGTGAKRTEGIRACVSLVRDDDLPMLDERLSLFSREHEAGGRQARDQ